MSKGRYLKDTPKRFPFGAIVFFAVVLVVGLALLLGNADFSPDPAVKKNPDSIAIPGYEMIQLAADTKKQSLSFLNPPQNMCYFQVSLYLEDGTLLWESDLIKPGKTSKPIVLEQPLEKGTYPNALLRYACFRIDDTLSPLNGAEMKLTLLVQ